MQSSNFDNAEFIEQAWIRANKQHKSVMDGYADKEPFRTAPITLYEITRNGKDYCIRLLCEGRPYSLLVDGVALTSFSAFKKALIHRGNILISHPADTPGKIGAAGKKQWREEIDAAIRRGQEVSETGVSR